jgi:hypothetical protein
MSYLMLTCVQWQELLKIQSWGLESWLMDGHEKLGVYKYSGVHVLKVHRVGVFFVHLHGLAWLLEKSGFRTGGVCCM